MDEIHWPEGRGRLPSTGRRDRPGNIPKLDKKRRFVYNRDGNARNCEEL